jgi:hypothetical protein
MSEELNIAVVSMKPIGYYASGDPYYEWHCSYPTSGVRLTETFETMQQAYDEACQLLRGYELRDPFGNMGSVIGVTAVENGWQGVWVGYHSNT